MYWASSRQTTRIEDISYCLMGIFDVNMPLLYGEGERAFFRLQEQILSTSEDDSILAWGHDFRGKGSCLAAFPSAFTNCHDIVWEQDGQLVVSHTVTNKGLFIELDSVEGDRRDTRWMVLKSKSSSTDRRVTLEFMTVATTKTDTLYNCRPYGSSKVYEESIPAEKLSGMPRYLFVHRSYKTQMFSSDYQPVPLTACFVSTRGLAENGWVLTHMDFGDENYRPLKGLVFFWHLNFDRLIFFRFSCQNNGTYFDVVLRLRGSHQHMCITAITVQVGETSILSAKGSLLWDQALSTDRVGGAGRATCHDAEKGVWVKVSIRPYNTTIKCPTQSGGPQGDRDSRKISEGFRVDIN